MQSTLIKLDSEKIAAILRSRFELLRAPKLSNLPPPEAFCDMQRAASIIAEHVRAGSLIAVVGDYDVDGVSSCAILKGFFSALNCKTLFIIPNRFRDGYGINAQIVERAARAGARIIITVDNGICAHEAAERAAELGVALIISDHHEPGEQLPRALAVIDPKRADCGFKERAKVDICGAQVAWWLAAAVKKQLGASIDMSRWLDILCLAISADMMPMRGLNTSLMHAGLRALNSSQKPFVQALRTRFGKQNFNFENISFLISPLLNSSGRMADASDSFEFLTAPSLAKASELLETIIEHNENRKLTEAQIYELACAQIHEGDSIIVAAGQGWHRGVIGIVAGKLANTFERPAVVFSIEGAKATGSARGCGELNLLEMFEHAASAILQCGGHKSAAGISCEAAKLAEFKRLANEYCAQAAPSARRAALLGELAISECNMQLLALINSFEPFGTDNEKPEFYALCEVASVKMLKNQHLKLQLICAHNQHSAPLDAICFYYKGREIQPGDRVQIIYQLAENDFFRPARLQLIIQKLF